MSDTWRELIADEMQAHGETWADAESIAPPDLDLDRSFDAGYGCEEGHPFTVWTAKRVYFPCGYDGAESAASVSRHPDGWPTRHIGGG
jgi:hypothetical protein